MRRIPKLAWVVIGPGLALALVEVTKAWVDPLVGSPFLAAIFLVSRFLGFGPAVAATLVSVFLLWDFFVFPPAFGLDLSGPALARLALFTVIAIVTAGLASLSKVD
jgi:K+-sensing histidine kinase KdpD